MFQLIGRDRKLYACNECDELFIVDDLDDADEPDEEPTQLTGLADPNTFWANREGQ